MPEVPIINPRNGSSLFRTRDGLADESGEVFPIINGVPRISSAENYSSNFGFQWNVFDRTQLDREMDGFDQSMKRLFAETRWDSQNLEGKNILEVGSGAGRFSKVILEHTRASLYSVDYSDAVSANFKNNGEIAPDRFFLFQANIYEMPFPDNSFDKVLCLGVLQHTPDFERSVKALISKAARGGEIVVDFYPIKGWWTKIHTKYLLRPFTKRMDHQKLLQLIDQNVNWLIKAHFFFHRIGCGFFTRFLPICNVNDSMPNSLPYEKLRELCVLDTFDQYSPEYDNPQRLKDVIRMFESNGATVEFSGEEAWEIGKMATVIRAIKD